MQDLENCGKTQDPGIRDPKVTQVRDHRNSHPQKLETPQNQKSKKGSELTGQER